MTAAQKIKTPVMVLPPLASSLEPAADMRALATRLRRLSLGDVLAGALSGAYYGWRVTRGDAISAG